jgi:hypothetical protein
VVVVVVVFLGWWCGCYRLLLWCGERAGAMVEGATVESGESRGRHIKLG